MLAAALASVALIAPMQEPTVQTGAASGVTTTTVTVSATVDGFGELTQYWFQYGTSTEYGGGTVALTETDPTPIPVSATITDLSPSTTYHYRIVAENPDGELHGADATFTTAPSGCPTVASTAAATGISATGATLHGIVSPTCGPVPYSFQYGLTVAYGQSTAMVSGAGEVGAAVSGLQAGRTYHFRLIAGMSDGADQTFRTAAVVKPIAFARAPRSVRARAHFRVTVGLRTAAVLTIEIVHHGRVVGRLRLGRRTGTVRARLRAPRAAGGYEIRVLATGGGTKETATLRLSVSRG